MSRGGRRAGAGRPKGTTTLDYMDRMTIGGKCQRLWREEYQKRLDAEVDKATKTVSEEWKKANAVPIPDRKKWRESDAGIEHREDVEFALQTDQGLADNEEPSRYLTLSASRPKGVRAEIIEQVAAEASAKYGFPISPRYVETCWKEFRSDWPDE